jgi:hypothetical protein
MKALFHSPDLNREGDTVSGCFSAVPDLNSPPFGGEAFQTNLIMPEPCPFLS